MIRSLTETGTAPDPSRPSMMTMRLPLILIPACLLLGGLAGCQTGKLPDPNSTEEVVQAPEIMMRNLVNWRMRLDRRVARRELSPEERDAIMAERVKAYVDLISPQMATAENAWIYGDLFRDAGRWKEAYGLYDMARKAAVTEDRKINDNLRFARAAARLGRHDEALAAVKSTFTAKPEDKAPILPAVLYEVVPAAEQSGKRPSALYARVLEEGVRQHLQTVVDASSEPGKAFLTARPTHIQRAWSKIVSLYQEAGDLKEARAAIARADTINKQSVSL